MATPEGSGSGSGMSGADGVDADIFDRFVKKALGSCNSANMNNLNGNGGNGNGSPGGGSSGSGGTVSVSASEDENGNDAGSSPPRASTPGPSNYNDVDVGDARDGGTITSDDPDFSNGLDMGRGSNGTPNPFISPTCPSPQPSKRKSRPKQKRGSSGEGGGGIKFTNFDFGGLDLLDYEYDEAGNENTDDLDYIYGDTDGYNAEMAELYSYNELGEFGKNLAAFDAIMAKWELALQWKVLDHDVKVNTIQRLLNQLDFEDRESRNEAAKTILYIAQGCWSEIRTPDEHERMTQENAELLIQSGAFAAVMDLLNLQIEEISRGSPSALAAASELPTILNILYTIIEMVRKFHYDMDEDYPQFIFHLTTPENESHSPVAVQLWKIVTIFTEYGDQPGAAAIPIKKVLLLLWKVLLLTLGGISQQFVKKNKYREMAGLPVMTQDTVKISMSLSTLQTGKEAFRKARYVRRQLGRQKKVDESEAVEGEKQKEQDVSKINGDGDEILPGIESDPISTSDNGGGPEIDLIQNVKKLAGPPRPASGGFPAYSCRLVTPGIPWTPKSRHAELDSFLEAARAKFIGISLPGDRHTVAGLPPNIRQGVETLQRNLHLSLCEWQIEREYQAQRMPFSAGEHELERENQESAMDKLYDELLPNCSQYVISLLKILLASSTLGDRNMNAGNYTGFTCSNEKKTRVSSSGREKPIIKDRSCYVNMLREVYSPPERGTGNLSDTVNQPKKIQNLDISRHKEIVTKAISAILVLLLKHSKLSHVYQFECWAQHLIFANCVPLILRYFNQDMHAHITKGGQVAAAAAPMKNWRDDVDLASLEFPACVLTTSEWTAEASEFSGRNLFAGINMLRVLNKLCKWKPARILMVVALKSHNILRKALTVRHPTMQLYILKLIKMQIKYLGKGWRKGNMKIVSAIYQKVRGRLGDNWMNGNQADSGPGEGSGWTEELPGCSFEEEECNLRANIERYHRRRFGLTGPKPIGSTLSAVLVPIPDPGQSLYLSFSPEIEGEYDVDKVLADAEPHPFASDFKAKYEDWMEKEVFQNPTDWDELLSATNGVL